MNWRIPFVLLGLLFGARAFAACDGLPWKFGMSPAEVSGISECGPYKTFGNGDLETYNGIFDGRKENFQFFFEDDKLRRIGVYLYEGQDPAAGARKWLSLHAALSRLFGEIETPGNTRPSVSEAEAVAFVKRALDMVDGESKTQMAPLSQPKDAFVFSSFKRLEVGGRSYYNVVLYFDRRS